MINSKYLKGIYNNIIDIISSYLPGETESNHEFMKGYEVFLSRFEFTPPA
jgi:hypothetical protein